MKIEEILKNAGIEDEGIIKAIAAEVPKHFVPSEEMSRRVNAAKKEAETAAQELEQYKAEVAAANEEAAKKAEAEGDASSAKIAEMAEQLEQLRGDYSASQTKLRETKAAEALREAIKAAGANPAAVELLVNANLASVTYDDEGTPQGVSELADNVKGANAGLFGYSIDTGKESGKADAPNDAVDDFSAGFGEITPRNRR